MTDPKSRVQLAHLPLAQHLLGGGLTRVCDELARFMLSFRDPDGFRLPEFDEREANVHPIAGGRDADWEARLLDQYYQLPEDEPLTTMPRDYDHGLAESKPSLAIQLSRACSELEESRASDLRHTRERDEAQARAGAEYDRGRREGREDVGKYANAIGLIDGALGLAGARPLAETVTAVEEKLTRIQQLEGRLSWLDEVVAQRDEAQAALTRQHRELAEALGMVHEPCMGPTWPAEWPLLLAELTRIKAELANSEASRTHYFDQSVERGVALSDVEGEITRIKADNERLSAERDHHLVARKQFADDLMAMASGGEVKTDLAASVVNYFRRLGPAAVASGAVVEAARFVSRASAYWGPNCTSSHALSRLRAALSALDRPDSEEQTAKEWYHPEPEAPCGGATGAQLEALKVPERITIDFGDDVGAVFYRVERWTKEELDRARAEGERLFKLFGGPTAGPDTSAEARPEILVGSTWVSASTARAYVVSVVGGVQYRNDPESGELGDYSDVSERQFRCWFTHVSDPE